jgi:endonuclease/exonuclease/phosphatase family metal-dependent hydrolase
MPWAGSSSELTSGINQRIPCTLKICEELRSITHVGEPIILGGDLNDDFHPIRILKSEMGFVDIFESLDLSPPITHPVRPSDNEEEMRPNRTIDWILTILPPSCKVIGAFTKTVRGGHYPPASDHMPVVGIIEIK